MCIHTNFGASMRISLAYLCLPAIALHSKLSLSAKLWAYTAGEFTKHGSTPFDLSTYLLSMDIRLLSCYTICGLCTLRATDHSPSVKRTFVLPLQLFAAFILARIFECLCVVASIAIHRSVSSSGHYFGHKTFLAFYAVDLHSWYLCCCAVVPAVVLFDSFH